MLDFLYISLLLRHEWVPKHLSEDDDFASVVISLPVESMFVYRI